VAAVVDRLEAGWRAACERFETLAPRPGASLRKVA
jgi:hypothetical protein